MKQRSAGVRIAGPVVSLLGLLLAYSGCELLVSDGDYKVDPGAFADGGTTGASSGASSGTSGASDITGGSGTASGTHSPEGGSGASGTTGTAGASSGATAGTTGAAGSTGTTGAAGTAAGASGVSGTTGAAGTAAGASGASGMGGSTGAGSGETGTTGTTGTSMPADAGEDHAAPDIDAGHIAGFDAGQEAGADSGTNICTPEVNDTSCDTCQRSSCCAPLAACGTDCLNIFTCVSNCVSTTSETPCGCFEQYPAGLAEFVAMMTCINTQCDDACDVVNDNGDPCAVSDECAQGSCGSSVSSHAPSNECTDDGCLADSDCESFVTNSGNDSFGEPVSCLQDGRNVTTCFPGCQSDADCAPYPGTSCQAATSVDSANVMVCELP